MKMTNYTSITMNASRNVDLENKDIGINPEAIIVIICVLNAPLLLISIFGNSLVLAAILRTPSLRSPSTVYLCSLAVSDLLVGLVVQPMYVALVLRPGSFLLQSYNMLALSCCGVSLSTMTAISVDRFLALHCHMRYPNLMTEKRALCTTVSLWFACLILSCLYFWDRNIFFLTIVVCIALCVMISLFSYIRIYGIVHRHQLQIRTQQQAVQNLNAEHNLSIVQRKESAINTFIYYICMILCYFPVLITLITQAVLPMQDIHLTVARAFATTVTFMNSAINPFLYCWRTRELRMIVLKTVRNILFRQTEGN